MGQSAPIRFLILLIGGWICFRIAVLAPNWWRDDAPDEQTLVAAAAENGTAVPAAIIPETTRIGFQSVSQRRADRPQTIGRLGHYSPESERSIPFAARSRSSGSRAVRSVPMAVPDGENAAAARAAQIASPLMPPATRLDRRMSLSGWLLLRRDGGTSLAPGGTLGGSQLGARLLYRLNEDARRPLALSSRIYAPLQRVSRAEAAVGLDWRPSARVPVHLLVERRQRLGREGRSAFSVTIYGGGSVPVGRGWRLDGYGQAGMVGTRSRDPFVDGSVRLSRAFGPVEIGGGLWGAAQPRASRLDAGPDITLPIRAGGASLRLSAQYRFRVTGNARPASGPALSLGVDF